MGAENAVCRVVVVVRSLDGSAAPIKCGGVELLRALR